MSQTLSLFPLSSVLMPCGRLPLQIFEQRYLDLVRDSMKTDTPFGVAWIRRGEEVAQRGSGAADLGDYGTCARIVDWDQLPNGLLGITIEGAERFELHSSSTRSNGLVVGEVTLLPRPEPCEVLQEWAPMLDVLTSLENHPHVQRMNLAVDYSDAWSVGCTLVQLLPLEEHVKYELLGLEEIDQLMSELDLILNQISG